MMAISHRRVWLALFVSVWLALVSLDKVSCQSTSDPSTSATTTTTIANTDTTLTATTTTTTVATDTNTATVNNSATTTITLATTTTTTESQQATNSTGTTTTTTAQNATTISSESTTTISSTIINDNSTTTAMAMTNTTTTTTTASSDDSSDDDSDSSSTARTLGILLAFAIVGIVVAVGGLWYFNRRQLIHANKYVTLADKLNSQSSRPSSPSNHQHGGTTISMNETTTNATRPIGDAQTNRAFGFDDNFVNNPPGAGGGGGGAGGASKNDAFNDPDFKFNFDEFQYQEKQPPSSRMGESAL